MEDQLIIRLFLERSEQAIDKISDKYGGLCKALSYKILRNEQDVEECVNDAYLAVWNTIPPQKPDSLSAYVCKITRNISLKRYRSNTTQKRNRFYDISLEEICECIEGSGLVEEKIEADALTECINHFLDTIHPIDRIIFIQRYWFCYKISEISKHLNKSTSYVNVHLHRTKNKLKKHLNQEGYL